MTKPLSANFLKSPAGILALQKIIALILAFSTTYLFIRFSSIDDFGSYAFSLAVVEIAAAFAGFGMSPLIVKHVASEYADPAYYAGLIDRTLANCFSVSGLLSFILGLIITLLTFIIEPIIWMSALVVPITVLLDIRTAQLQGAKHPRFSQLPTLVLRPALIILIGFGAYEATGKQLLASDLMLIYLVASVMTAALVYLFMRSRFFNMTRVPEEQSLQAEEVGNQYSRQEFLRDIRSLGISSAGFRLTRYLDILILGFILPPSSIGLYKAGSQIAQFVAFGLQIGAVILAREFAARSATGQLHSLAPKLRTASLSISSAAFIIYAVVIVVLGENILRVLTGSPAGEAYIIALILGGGHLLSCVAGNQGLLLNMCGLHSVTARWMIRTLVVHMFWVALLTFTLGLFGAAIGTAISVVFNNYGLTREARARLPISTDLIFALSFKGKDLRR